MKPICSICHKPSRPVVLDPNKIGTKLSYDLNDMVCLKCEKKPHPTKPIEFNRYVVKRYHFKRRQGRFSGSFSYEFITATNLERAQAVASLRGAYETIRQLR